MLLAQILRLQWTQLQEDVTGCLHNHIAGIPVYYITGEIAGNIPPLFLTILARIHVSVGTKLSAGHH